MKRSHFWKLIFLPLWTLPYWGGVKTALAQIALTQSVNLTAAAPGDPITYFLNYTNASAPATCSDGFEGDATGVLPPGWTESAADWTSVNDNSTRNAAGTRAAQGIAPAGQYPNLLDTCAGQVGDGALQADLKIGANGQTGVLLWRFTGTNTPSAVNGSNYQADIVPGNNNNVSVDYYDDGTATFHTVALGTANITAGTWYTVLFQVTGTGSGTVTLSLSVNGTQVIPPTTTTFSIGSGQAGLQVNSGSTVEFDNVSISKFTQTYNVTVSDTLPAGLAYVSASGAPSVSGQKVVWTLGNLANNASGSLTVAGAANSCGQTLVNTGEADSGLPQAAVVSAAVSTALSACTATPSPTATVTATNSATGTATRTATVTPTLTPTPTGSSTATPTATPSATHSPTDTSTGTATDTPTSTATSSATNTASSTATLTATDTATDTPTSTPTATASPTATVSMTPTDSPTSTPADTSTDTATSTETSSATDTVTGTATLTQTDTATDTATSTATSTPASTASATSTGTPADTATDTPAFTATFTSTNTATPTATLTATSTATDTATTASFTPTSTASLTPTHTAASTPTGTFTLVAAGTATSTPTFTASPTASNTPLGATDTPTSTVTATSTSTPTSTPGRTPASTATGSPTRTLTVTPTGTPTSTATPSATLSATAAATRTATSTPSPTPTSTATGTPTGTRTQAPTATSSPAFTASPSPTASPTSTPKVTATFSATASPTTTGTLTALPTVPAGNCSREQVDIYDERGEWVRTLCGTLPLLKPQTIAYTVSGFAPNAAGTGGTLTIRVNGQAVALWDATDGKGDRVPNGFYQMILTQHFTDGSSARLSQAVFVAPSQAVAQVSMAARPNLAHPGGIIHVSVFLDGAPVTGRGALHVYSLNGELLRTLDLVNGQGSWDLTNGRGEIVASGLYLLGFSAADPKTGTPASKVLKVAVLR